MSLWKYFFYIWLRFKSGHLSKEDYPPKCEWASFNQLSKDWDFLKKKFSLKTATLILTWISRLLACSMDFGPTSSTTAWANSFKSINQYLSLSCWFCFLCRTLTNTVHKMLHIHLTSTWKKNGQLNFVKGLEEITPNGNIGYNVYIDSKGI